jgi:RluA family pseudouridine synthase
VPKSRVIELNDGTTIPILFENRSVLAIDKPAGWMLVPFNWQRTNRNLHAAIVAAIGSGQFWAKSRGLKFLCHVHRLDAETTGILLLARSRGALDTLGDLFESRQVAKRYLAVVRGVPKKTVWTSHLKLSADEDRIGRVRVDQQEGKPSETHFQLLASEAGKSLIEARPVTGRTHQIRVHLAAADLPVVGDPLYGPKEHRPARPSGRKADAAKEPSMALRAIDLAYLDPFTRSPVIIHAPFEPFVKRLGFDPACVPPFEFDAKARKPVRPRRDTGADREENAGS